MSIFNGLPDCPFALFTKWYNEALKNEPDVPDAMSVATTNADGFPSVRIVLMKDFSKNGFVFYTNLKSQKSKEILENPKICLNFHWKSLKKQIRIQGHAHPVSNETADKYFATRPRLSQLGAWASIQSQEMPDRFSLEKRVAEFTARFGLSSIPRPEFWSGFCIEPIRIEFWHEMPFRLHDRIVYHLNGSSDWTIQRLYP